MVSGLSVDILGECSWAVVGPVASLPKPKIDGFCASILAAVGEVVAGDLVTRGAKSRPILGRVSISRMRVIVLTRCMASTADGDIDADIGDRAEGDLGAPPCTLEGRESIALGEISNEIARRADRPFFTSTGDNPCELDDGDSNVSGLALAGGLV